MAEGKQLPMLRPEKNPGQPPIFQRVGIVGLGLIGGSIALAAREIWPGALVIGVDRKDVLERAMVLHAIDVAADDAGRPRRSGSRDSGRAHSAEPRDSPRAARQRHGIGCRHRHRQHEARGRRGCRVAARSIYVHRRPSAGRRGSRWHRSRAPRHVQRAPVAVHARQGCTMPRRSRS